MKLLTPRLIALASSLGLVLLHILWIGPMLPETVVSHHGPGGVEDGWMGRGTFIACYLGLTFGLGGLMAAVGYLPSWLPNQRINVPNAVYWNTAANRPSACHEFVARMTELALLVVLVCIYFFHGTMGSNLPAGTVPSIPGSFWNHMGIVAIVYVGWFLGFRWSFRVR